MFQIRSISQRLYRNRDGATAVEAAMVFPMIIMSIFALFHVAVFFFSTHQAQRTTEQAARDIRMMSQPSQSEIEKVVEERLKDPIGGVYSTIIYKVNEHGGTFADIRISYEYTLPIPFLDKHVFESESGTRVLLRDFS